MSEYNYKLKLPTEEEIVKHICHAQRLHVYDDEHEDDYIDIGIAYIVKPEYDGFDAWIGVLKAEEGYDVIFHLGWDLGDDFYISYEGTGIPFEDVTQLEKVVRDTIAKFGKDEVLDRLIETYAVDDDVTVEGI